MVLDIALPRQHSGVSHEPLIKFGEILMRLRGFRAVGVLGAAALLQRAAPVIFNVL